MTTRVSTDSRTSPPSHVSPGGDGKKPPPTNPSNSTDSISPNSDSSRGFLGTLFSPITYLMTLVFDGFAFCGSLIRWPLEKLGILSLRQIEKPPAPQKNLEDQAKELKEEFAKGSHAHRLYLLVDNSAWPEMAPEEFFVNLFVEVFNLQDKSVITALNEEVFDDFDWGEEIETELPKQLYEALYAKTRTGEQSEQADRFQRFLFSCPDYALKYAASCFEPDAPAFLRYRALEILAAHRGKAEDFHIGTIDDKEVRVVLQEAFKTYFDSLTVAEKYKLIDFVPNREFRQIDSSLISNLDEVKDDERVVCFLERVPEYKKSSNFKGFLTYLLDHCHHEWTRFKEEIFKLFPKVRDQYFEAKFARFVTLDGEVKRAACMQAYETTPRVLEGRLRAIIESENEYVRAQENEKLLSGNTSAAVQLFYLYRDRFIRSQVGLYQKPQAQAIEDFTNDWDCCFDFKTGSISRLQDFVDKMVLTQRDPDYSRAAQDLLNITFSPE